MKHTLLAFIALFVLFSCSKEENIRERPRDPWVFRSVLDEQSRIITVALHDEMYVAYDAQHGGLYKAWKGGVNFDGAVYTTKHGPQPTSKGYAYYTKKMDQPAWVFVKGGEEIIPEVLFKGYQFKEGQVYLNYELKDDQGNRIRVQEKPEYVSQKGKNGLSRSFIVSDVPEGVKVGFHTALTSMKSERDYETDGEFKVTNQSKEMYTSGTTHTVEGLMVLNSDGQTELKVYFHPGFDREGARHTVEDVKAAGADQPEGKKLIENSDCKTCHNETKKTVGPAYVEIARRYPNSEAVTNDLAQKIIAGGTGNWGEVPMTAHPDLQEDDAKQMVAYILSLDGEEPESGEAKGEGEDLMLGVAPVQLQLTDNNQNLKEGDETLYDGLAANAYLWNDYNLSFKDLTSVTAPIMSGAVPVLHFDEASHIGRVRDNIYIEFNGFVDAPETSNYVFRLVSDDGSRLYIEDKLVIDNFGFHGPEARDGEVYLQKGLNKIKIEFYQGLGGAALSFQWAKYGDNKFSVVPSSALKHRKTMFKEVVPYIAPERLMKSIPGDQRPLTSVHPAFDLFQARPDDFEPKVGGMDFLSDGRMVVCTWDSVGPVYIVEGVNTGDPSKMKVKRIASGLAEPLGLKVVDDDIYVLQKHELTRLIDHNGDEIIDEYRTVSDAWRVSANFHEFAFGLAFKDGHFYATLAIAIMPGGASAQPQIPDRGKVAKISKEDGSVEFVAHGLRTPNGIGIGADSEIFVADNQGDWLPSSKIVHVQEGAWFGSRAVDFEGTADMKETKPVVWLPQDEIGNSPSTPSYLNVGPYQDQMIHGEVTHGGIKRVFVEKVDGKYQGAVFRFIQGLEAGVNRITWGPDGDLYVGGIGNPGNWQHNDKLWYGLQRLHYNGNSVFEPLAIRAKSNGIEVEFTQPIALNQGQNINDYLVKQWYYKPTEDYGGPKLDLKELRIKSLNMSDDRKQIFLELEGMKPDHVVHFRVVNPFVSSEGQSLWTTEGWYTMNAIPANDPGFVNPTQPVVHNQLTVQEKKEGWKLLFDGQTTAGWRKFKEDKVGSAWKVANGTLYLDNSRKDGWQVVGGGDIITDQEYEDYELTLEWKVEEGGNSGVIYNVVENDEYDYVWQTGPEMQILDNVKHPDGRIEKHRAGDLYDMIETKFVTVKPGGEWNRIRIVSKGGHVEHWQNGYKVVEFQMHTPEWQDMIRNSKFKDMPGFGQAKKGHIALQDHGDKVWFRNIKIREL
ncbi:Putative secreted glycosyl hydrolase [Fulvivirga imtechensis AK7]|uniref:Putative secreted glycosyl hydrolase n=1 Tax=Fulvivirga imtechensis AK7 TaxID=1237149 RepID=L8JYB7_9BACT|nr:family 16 glycoside hydrolase [Fulvivirga imtechensis]ELR73750.1 Putative secreted glycosyl hydrolase [Fulvivirga imtechensis AK7]